MGRYYCTRSKWFFRDVRTQYIPCNPCIRLKVYFILVAAHETSQTHHAVRDIGPRDVASCILMGFNIEFKGLLCT